MDSLVLFFCFYFEGESCQQAFGPSWIHSSAFMGAWATRESLTLGLSTLQSLLNQSKSSRISHQFTVLSCHFISAIFPLSASFNHNLFQPKAMPSHMISNRTSIALLQSIWRGKKVLIQLNHQYQMWKSAICNYRLTLHCFLFHFFWSFLLQTLSHSTQAHRPQHKNRFAP